VAHSWPGGAVAAADRGDHLRVNLFMEPDGPGAAWRFFFHNLTAGRGDGVYGRLFCPLLV
jgi:hypothetical protein